MGLQLPGELAHLLNELGYVWPNVDEQKLLELGHTWMRFASTVEDIHADAGAAAGRVWSDNTAAAAEAFAQAWGREDAAAVVLDRGHLGAQAIGGALLVCAAAVLALKVNVIAQLAWLLAAIVEAIATAEFTFGASLLEIPAFKKLADMAINFVINQAMQVILG
jgi:hypothetical protein